MSHCITDLRLDQPPAFTHSRRTSLGKLWIVVCAACHHETTVQPKLSAALEEQHQHCIADHAAPVLAVVA